MKQLIIKIGTETINIGAAETVEQAKEIIESRFKIDFHQEFRSWANQKLNGEITPNTFFLLTSNKGNPQLFIVDGKDAEAEIAGQFEAAREKKEAFEKIERERVSKILQAREAEMIIPNEGWYVVELPCHSYNRNFDTKLHYTNWKVLATSPMDAYHHAVQAAERKGYFDFEIAERCQVDFYGVWDDEKQMALREEGLVGEEEF